MARKILLVGSGITTAVASALLKKHVQDKVKLVIWDKARGAGGRMGTSRSPGDAECTADLGAQYITALPENMDKNRDIYSSLLSAGVLEPLVSSAVFGMKKNFPSGTEHFVAPNGMSSIVKHFIAQGAPDDTCFSHHVSSISHFGDKLQVETQTGKREEFDIVILTMPAPQILQLSGTVPSLIASQPDLQTGLHSVSYSSRYAVALYFQSGDSQHEPWAAKYIEGHPVFRYVAFDNRKRNQPERPPAAVLHTSVTYGKEHVEKTVNEMEPLLLEEYRKLFPHWPQPAAVKCHKWRYSQVMEAFPGKPGSVTLLCNPLLIAAGDSFSGSGFDSCVSSAHAVVDQVIAAL